MRRIILALCMSLLAAVVFSGCKQQCFMTECDYNYYMDRGIAQLENDPTISIVPATSDSPAPATVLNPEREIRYLTLREAIATALENGSPGTTFLPDPLGNYNDSLIGASRGTINNEDSIRAFSYDPAILGAEIEKSLSKFDAYMVSGIQWFTTDQPVGSAIQTIQALGRRDIQQDNAQVFAGVYKQLPTGGTAGIGFSTNYQLSNLAQRVNPAYQPNLAFSFSQPLLQGYGVEINQLRRFHPGLTNFENQAISRALGGFGLLPSFPGSQSAEGILLTRVTFDQSRAEFERNLNIMITNVEVAYWNLYGAYWTLYSREQALRQGYETWRIVKAAYEAGRTAIQDYAQARQQYELFRGQRLAALGEVLEKERDLRGFMGLPAEDGYRLVPIDTPTIAPYQPDWHTAVNEALSKRPELILARQDVKRQQLNLIAQKNFLLPDLRFVSTYGITGLGSRLDGPGANNAFRSLSSNQFNNWSLGLQMTMPIGFREAHANVRQARLQLARSYAVLQTQEEKAKRYLAQQYRLLFETYEQIKIQRAQREAAAQQLRARYLEFLAGRGTLDILLEAQRVWADALKAEYDNIVAYNNALAGFEFAKGTIQEYNNITIAEGGLPECGRERAVEHEKRRCIQLLKRERANPIQYAPCANDPTCKARIPELPEDKVPSLPALTDLEELLKRDTETVHAAKAEKTQVIGKEIVQPNATSVVEPTQFETRTPTDNVNPDDQTMKTEPEKNHVAGRRDRRPPAKSEFVLPPIPKGAKMSLPPWEQPDPNQR